jgi:hypothetical protein
MPGGRTPAQEAIWTRAKKAVEKSKGKAESAFTDRDWGLVQTIYKELGGT